MREIAALRARVEKAERALWEAELSDRERARIIRELEARAERYREALIRIKVIHTDWYMHHMDAGDALREIERFAALAATGDEEWKGGERR